VKHIGRARLAHGDVAHRRRQRHGRIMRDRASA